MKTEAERLVKNAYSVSTEERETFEEEVTLTVTKGTKSEITFFWKEIRQRGDMQISGAGFEAQIPYAIVVGLTFDQQQVDSPQSALPAQRAPEGPEAAGPHRPVRLSRSAALPPRICRTWSAGRPRSCSSPARSANCW